MFKVLNIPHYTVDEFGNIYRFAFWQSGLNEQKCLEIQYKRKYNKLSQKQLSTEYNVSRHTIKRVLETQIDNFWIKMRPGLGTNGRYHVILHNKNTKKKYCLAKLICEVFHGPCPDGMECCHNDGNKLNNRTDNLRWDTHKNNCYDRVLHNTLCKGSKIHNSKLSESDIPNIRNQRKQGMSYKQIASQYNVCEGTIGSIIKNKNWKHIPYEEI